MLCVCVTFTVAVHLGTVSDHCPGINFAQLAARNVTICATV